MATDTATTQAQGIGNFASGSTTGDGTATAITLGFTPRYVRVFNATDVITWEKYAEQVDANTAKLTAVAVQTLDTGSGIVFKGAGATDTYKGFQLSATLAASGKSLFWIAFA